MVKTGVKVTWKGERVTKEIAARLERGIIAAANHFAKKLKGELLATHGSIEEGYHSEPGQIPFYISGKLAGSIRVQGKYRTLSKISIDIVSRLDYDRFLEFGTYKMAPRPHWMVVFNQEEGAMKDIIKKQFTLNSRNMYSGYSRDVLLEGIENVSVERIGRL